MEPVVQIKPKGQNLFGAAALLGLAVLMGFGAATMVADAPDAAMFFGVAAAVFTVFSARCLWRRVADAGEHILSVELFRSRRILKAEIAAVHADLVYNARGIPSYVPVLQTTGVRRSIRLNNIASFDPLVAEQRAEVVWSWIRSGR